MPTPITTEPTTKATPTITVTMPPDQARRVPALDIVGLGSRTIVRIRGKGGSITEHAVLEQAGVLLEQMKRAAAELPEELAEELRAHAESLTDELGFPF